MHNVSPGVLERTLVLASAALLGLAGCHRDENPTDDASHDAAVENDAALPGDAATQRDAETDAGVEPACAAQGGARCFYVAPDGDDSAEGSIDAPFATFRKAMEQAQPGDIIYARGGRYGLANAMIAHMERLPQDRFPPPCAAGQVEADGYCQVPKYEFASISSWNGYPLGSGSYEMPDGEARRPITLRNFPGEVPVLDMAELSRGDEIEGAMPASQKIAIGIVKSHWVIRGFEIVGGSIDLRSNIRDITIEYCHIHDLVRDGGDNPGLIRINRGPEDVRILHNRLHDISDIDSPGVWDSSAEDAQHFGAVTTLSGETYGGDDDTGAIEIAYNEIYHVPQVFFFKNAAAGPIEIRDNRIYECGRLASNVSSNVHLVGNLVVDVPTGIWRQGQGFTELGTQDPAVLAIDGQNLTIEYNTFVGLGGTLVNHRFGEGRDFHHNVIFGLPDTAQSANWDSSSYIKGVDGIGDLMASNHNCFIVPDPGFQHLAVYFSDHVDHYDILQSRSLFGLDLDSTVVVSSDPAEVFTDPSSGDYSLKAAAGCGQVGHAVPH